MKTLIQKFTFLVLVSLLIGAISCDITGDGMYSDFNLEWHEDCTPILISPAEGDEMDNGCYGFTDFLAWTFDWEDCEEATQYHLYVKHEGSSYPVIDKNDLTISSYASSSTGSYIVNQNRLNWRWKVRALINGIWGEWSEERTYNVEPLDTDCPE